MLKTNSKQAKANFREIVTDYYSDVASDDNITIAEALKRDVDSIKFGNITELNACMNLARHGNFAISYFDQRAELESALEQTSEESAKYSDNKVFETYCTLIGRAVQEIINGKG